LDCIGVEGSVDAIEIAQARFPSLRLKRHLLSQPLPFSDGCFQTVVVNQVISTLLLDVAAFVVSESLRVLRPGGAIIINSPSCFDRRQRGDLVHAYLYSPSELRRLLASSGFVRITDQNTPIPLFGTSPIGTVLSRWLFHLPGAERLSATANAVGYKPGAHEAEAASERGSLRARGPLAGCEAVLTSHVGSVPWP
jgi:SAM-dependent methyltransferase